MEDDAVVEAAFGQRDEVADRDRRQVGVEREVDRALRRFDRHRAGLAGGQRRRLGGRAVAGGGRTRCSPGRGGDERGLRRQRGRGRAGRSRCTPRRRPGSRRPRSCGWDEGSCGSLQGSGKVDGAGEDRLPEDDAGGAGVAHPAQRVEIADPAGDQDLGIVRPNERTDPLEVRRAPAVGEHEAGHPGRDELLDQGGDRRRRRSDATGTRRVVRAAGRGRPPASPRRSRGTRAGRRAGRRWPSSARPAWHRPRTRAGSPRPSRGRRRAAAAPRSGTRSRRPHRDWPGCLPGRPRSRRGG